MVGGTIAALACLLMSEPAGADPSAVVSAPAPVPAIEGSASTSAVVAPPVPSVEPAPLVRVRPHLDVADLYDPWAVPVQSVVPRAATEVTASIVVTRPIADPGLLDPWALRSASVERAPVDPDLRHPFGAVRPPPSPELEASPRLVDLRDPFARALAPRPPQGPAAGVLTSPDLRDPFVRSSVAPSAPSAPATPSSSDPFCNVGEAATSPSAAGRCAPPVVVPPPHA